jgi:hypothetical protein
MIIRDRIGATDHSELCEEESTHGYSNERVGDAVVSKEQLTDGTKNDRKGMHPRKYFGKRLTRLLKTKYIDVRRSIAAIAVSSNLKIS